MKVQLIVSTPGANQGRAIPITGAQFMIGRDPDCQLRPASPAISKKHCGILIRDGKVYVQDLGSMNGTLVNGEVISGTVAVENGATLKAGPLEFRIEIEISKRRTDSTPLPEQLKPLSSEAEKLRAAVGPEALKPATEKPSATLPKLPQDAVAPQQKVKPKSETTKPTPKPVPAAATDEDHEAAAAAAMLLGLDDDEPGTGENPSIPDGSTVMEMPAVNAEDSKEAEKKKKSISGAEMSAAANDILRKYIRRTGN